MSKSHTPDVDPATFAAPPPPEQPAAPTEAERRARSVRRRRLLSVLAGLAAGVLVALAGAYVATNQTTTYTATSQLLLAPTTQDAGSVTSGLYDTLSSGQLPATAAAIIQEKRFLRAALVQEGADSAGVTVNVTVVQDTSIVQVAVVAPRPGVAAQLADAIPQKAIPEVNAALTPFQLTTLGSAEGSQSSASLSDTQWIVLIAVAALVVAGVVQRLLRPRVRPGQLEA